MEIKDKTRKIKCFEDIPETVRQPCEQFTSELQKQRKSMEMTTKDKCKAVLFYWPVVSRAGTDIEAALQKLRNDYKDKYVALVVLHHTFDPESSVPDSSRAVNRENQENQENPLVVDCLFHEDKGLLPCHKNDEAVKKVADWLKRVKLIKNSQQQPKQKNNEEKGMKIKSKINIKIKCFEDIPETVRQPCEQFTSELQKQRKSMEMTTKDKCKAVLFYWPIVSRVGTDIEAALQKLRNDYKDKYVALVVLHHTFDPESSVPDSSRAVNRENQENPLVVDCLFHEDKGLLLCCKNDEAVKKVADWLKRVKNYTRKNPNGNQDKAIHEMRAAENYSQ